MKFVDYYKIMGVADDASAEEIKKGGFNRSMQRSKNCGSSEERWRCQRSVDG